MRSENSRKVCAKTFWARSLATIDGSKRTPASAVEMVPAETPLAAASFFTLASQASKLGSFWHPAATAPVAPAARSTAAAAYSPALVMIGRISVLAPFVTIGGPSTRPRPRRGLLRDDIVGAVAAERLVGVAQRGHGDAADQGRDNVVDHALDDQQVGGPAKGGGQFLQAVHREHPLEDQPD